MRWAISCANPTVKKVCYLHHLWCTDSNSSSTSILSFLLKKVGSNITVLKGPGAKNSRLSSCCSSTTFVPIIITGEFWEQEEEEEALENFFCSLNIWQYSTKSLGQKIYGTFLFQTAGKVCEKITLQSQKEEIGEVIIMIMRSSSSEMSIHLLTSWRPKIVLPIITGLHMASLHEAI